MLAHISSLGSGSFLHSGYILLCWALTGEEKEADVRDMSGVLEHLWGVFGCPQATHTADTLQELSESWLRDWR